MNYFELFRVNKKILAFGILMTLFSSFGQTFLLSLYIPGIIETFSISSAFFSRIYAMATMLSAASLMVFGKLIDRVPLMRFTVVVILGLVAANILAGLSWHWIILFVSVYLLRFFGQGLFSHTSMTTMARYFNKARGKSLSVAYLGFPIGEGFLPVAMISIILWLGWRQTFFLVAALILLTLLPVVIWLIKGFKDKPVYEEKEIKSKTAAAQVSEENNEKLWRQRDLVRTPHFWLFAPTVFLVGFTLTALFFYQTFIADFKGWSLEWMAASIMAYALSSFAFSLGAGPLIDRFSARRVFPFVLIPMAFGLALLAVSNQTMSVPIFWFLLGVSAGINAPLTSALYAETFGTRNLGAVRSVFTFVMVASTALGPVVFGFFLQKDFSFNQIHLMLAGLVLLNCLAIIVAETKKVKQPVE